MKRELENDLDIVSPPEDILVIGPASPQFGLTDRERAPGSAFKSKVEQYGWKVKGRAGRFAKIHKSRLRVDPSYQRTETLSQKKLSEIRAEVNPPAYSCLTVVRRRDGSLWVVEGQHRFEVALDRVDMQFLPCLLYEENDLAGDFDGLASDSATKEAEVYLEINAHRSTLKSIDKFKAQLKANDPKAARVQYLLDKYGYQVSRSTGLKAVRCVKSLTESLNRMPIERTEAIWDLTVSLHHSTQIQEEILRGLFYAEYIFLKFGQEHSLLRSHNRQRLVDLGTTGILEFIISATRYFKRGHETSYAQGIVDALNFRRTSRRLPDIRQITGTEEAA